ncbi:hypothetical protein JHK85_010352 [Glycine max]|nr:hypothetical protein JHK85_010352 [Glycine max]
MLIPQSFFSLWVSSVPSSLAAPSPSPFLNALILTKLKCWNVRKRRHEELPADGANATERRRGARRHNSNVIHQPFVTDRLRLENNMKVEQVKSLKSVFPHRIHEIIMKPMGKVEMTEAMIISVGIVVSKDVGDFSDDEDLMLSEIAFYREVIGEQILKGEMLSSDEECDSSGDESDPSKDMTSP